MSLAVCSIVLGCGAGEPLRLAVVLPLSGPDARCGVAIHRGVELAAREEASRERPEIELRIEDTGGDGRRGAELLASLYEQGAVAAIGGVDPEGADVLAAVAREKDRVLLSPSPVSLGRPEGESRQFFRLAPSPLQEASALVSFVNEALGLRQWVVVRGASASSAARLAVVERVAAARRLTTIEGPPLAGGRSDLERLLETLRASGAAGAVLLVADARTVNEAAVRLRQAGFDGRILATSAYALTADSPSELDSQAAVLFPLSAFDATAGELPLRRFAAAFQRHYGVAPDLCAANGYDAVRLLAEAARRGGASPRGVWKGLRGIRDFPGTRRALQFDDRGEVLDFPRIHRFERGALVDHEDWLAEWRQDLEHRIRVLERRRLELLGERGGG